MTSLQSFSLEEPRTLKADLDGTIFAYDCRERLAYVMAFDHSHAHNFHLRHPNVVPMSWV